MSIVSGLSPPSESQLDQYFTYTTNNTTTTTTQTQTAAVAEAAATAEAAAAVTVTVASSTPSFPTSAASQVLHQFNLQVKQLGQDKGKGLFTQK